MNFDPQTIRSILFLVGMTGIVEQEAVRVLFGIPPSPEMVKACLALCGVSPIWAAGEAVTKRLEIRVRPDSKKGD